MMKKDFLLILIALVFMYAGCSELRKDLPVASTGTLKIHEAGWGNVGSQQFHGKYLKANEYRFDECVSCHAKNYQGGTSGISCYKCHSSYPHNDGWEADTSRNTFHGKYLKIKNWEADECKTCHGATYSGGTSEKACFDCHPSFPHEVKFQDGENHNAFMIDNYFPLEQCKLCHGSSYTGGTIVEESCSSSECHATSTGVAKSPEACNTCHGNFRATADDVPTFAPPRAINGDTSTSVRSVGAHQKHLASGTFGKAVKCSECHNVPTTISEPWHIEQPFNVSVVFNDTLARMVSADGPYIPFFHSPSLTCNNTFCHGNWKLRKSSSPYQFAYNPADSVMVGNKFAPLWTGGSTQAACGTTCHNTPPNGHISSAITGCSSCHTGVIENTGTIIDKTKHINGKINVFGSERSFQ